MPLMMPPTRGVIWGGWGALDNATRRVGWGVSVTAKLQGASFKRVKSATSAAQKYVFMVIILQYDSQQ